MIFKIKYLSKISDLVAEFHFNKAINNYKIIDNLIILEIEDTCKVDYYNPIILQINNNLYYGWSNDIIYQQLIGKYSNVLTIQSITDIIIESIIG